MQVKVLPFVILGILALPLSGKAMDFPEVLDLPTANRIAQQQAPALQALAQKRQLLEANLLGTQAGEAFNLKLVGQVGWHEYTRSRTTRDEEHHILYLQAEKPLYDFGKTQRLSSDWQSQLEMIANETATTQAKLEEEVLAAYADAYLSDLHYRWKNEEMTMAYLTWGKAKENLDYGRVDEEYVAELEVKSETALQAWRESGLKQQTSRLHLAAVLGVPTARPDGLTPIKVAKMVKNLPNLNDLLPLLNTENPQLQILDAQIAQAKRQQNAYSAWEAGQLKAYARAGGQSHMDLSGEGAWALGVSFNLPLVDGGKGDAEAQKLAAQALALEIQRQSLLASLQSQLTQAYIQLLNLQSNEKLLAAKNTYAERHLDKARTQYDLELKADIGNAMVEAVKVSYELAKQEMDLAKAYKRIENLIGKQGLALVQEP